MKRGRKPRITFFQRKLKSKQSGGDDFNCRLQGWIWFQFSTVSKGFTKLLKKWWTAARPIKFVVRRAIRGFHNHETGKKAPDYIFSKKIGNQNNQEATTSIVASKVEFWFQFSTVSKGFTKLLKKWWTAARPIKFVVRRAIRGFHNHETGKKAPDYIFSRKLEIKQSGGDDFNCRLQGWILISIFNRLKGIYQTLEKMMNGRTTDKVCSEEGNPGFHNHETGRKPRITFFQRKLEIKTIRGDDFNCRLQGWILISIFNRLKGIYQTLEKMMNGRTTDKVCSEEGNPGFS